VLLQYNVAPAVASSGAQTFPSLVASLTRAHVADEDSLLAPRYAPQVAFELQHVSVVQVPLQSVLGLNGMELEASQE